MIPKNEKQRLAALKSYEILDSEQEQAFDRITKLASLICETPIALISLLDEERQWFKAKVGLTVDHTPRCISFCQYAIMGDDCFEVPDAMEDERFKDNPLVLENPNIRFYAGCPLSDSEGYNLGTLCVIDEQPKKLTDNQKEALGLLAEEVVQLMVSRKKQTEAQRLAKLFDLSLDLMTIADTDGNFIEVNKSWATILGFEDDELKGKKFLDFVHPNDLESTLEALKQLGGQNQVIGFKNRYLVKDGSYRLIEWQATPQGKLIYAVARDITDQEQNRQALFKANNILKEAEKITKMGAWELDLSTNQTFWTDEVYAIHELEKGFDHNKVNGIEFYHPDYRQIISNAISKSILEQTSFDEKCKFITAKGNTKWVRSTGHPIIENEKVIKLFGVFIDITAEEEKNQLFEQEKSRLSSIIQGTNVGTWEWNVQTGETVFNEKWAEIIGYSLEELEPININTWTKFAHPEDLIDSGELLNQHFEGKLDYYHFECRMKHKNGHWVWVLDRGKVVSWTKEGKPLMMYGTHQDISHRKEIELSLKHQNQLISSFFELSPIGLALNDFETGQFIQVNQALLNAIGYSHEEFVTLSYFDLTPKKYFEREKEMLASLNSSGSYGPFEKEYIHKDGSFVSVLLKGVIVEDVDGSKKIWSVIEDISERKQVEKDQLWRLEFQQFIAKHSSNFILTNSDNFDENINLFLEDLGKHLKVDRSFLFLSTDNMQTVSNTHEWCNTGITPQIEPLQDVPMEAFPWVGPKMAKDKLIHIPNVGELPDEAELERDEFSRQEIKSVLLLELADASTRYGFIGFDSVIDYKVWSDYEINTLKVIANTIADVLRKKHQEEELRASKLKLESVLNEVDDIIWSVDASDYSLILITPSAVPFYGFSLKEWENDSQLWAKVVHPDDKHIVDLCFRDLETNGEFVYEYRIFTKHGVLKWVKNKGKIIKESSGRIRIDGAISDISKEKKYLEELEASKKIAEKAVLAKDEFLANMSHEIRTPLNAIIGFSEVLANSPLSPTQKKQMETVSLASNNLMNILNDVLDTSKLESGAIQLEKRVIPIQKICMELINIHKVKANEKMILLSSTFEKEVPTHVVGDETRISQIINNILSNAIKFTVKGSVQFNTSVVQQDEKMVLIRFKVSDTGIGIPKSKQELIFNRFVQAESSTTRKFGGTGLGMSIVKSLVELHKGNVKLESTIGKGTTITVDIPFSKALKISKEEERFESNHLNKALEGISVLVVEDNEFNQQLVFTILENAGAEVAIANDGVEGLEAIKNRNFDVVLMDLQMPNMDGYQATKILIEQFNYKVPIIACSAHSIKKEKEDCLAIGMKDYISKPFKREFLINSIKNVLPKREKTETIENVTESLKALKTKVGEDVFLQLVTLYQKRIPEDIEKIKKHVSLNEKQMLINMFHKLISTLSSMEFKEGYKFVRTLEDKLQIITIESLKPDIHLLINYLKDTLKQIKHIS